MLNNEYFLWGAGTYGKRIIEFMKNDLTFKAVIDNDLKKQGTIFCSVPVISYEEAKGVLPGVKIVIALNVPTEVRDLLIAAGFVENKDFFVIHDFIPRYYWKKNKSLVIKSVDIPATTICNMKCEACQTFIPIGVTHRHMSAKSIMSDIDLMFTHIDSVMNFNFCVGESLLNKELPDICSYIYENFAKRYGWVLIQTNGTIKPEDDIMQRFSESKTLFGFSNYPENIKSINKLIEKCNKHNIGWYFNRAGDRKLWYDVGDPRIENEMSHDKLRELCTRCWKPGMAIVNQWLYICAEQAWSHLVAEVGTLNPGDAFDLNQPMTDTTREELYKIISRQPPEAGYISHCKRCNSVMTPYVIK